MTVSFSLWKMYWTRCILALSITVEGDELVAQLGSGDTLRGGHVPLNKWSHIAVQHQSNKMVNHILQHFCCLGKHPHLTGTIC